MTFGVWWKRRPRARRWLLEVVRTRNTANADITLRNLKGAELVVNNLLDAREWADASGWPTEGRVLVCASRHSLAAIARHLDDKGRDMPMGSIAQQNFMGQAR